MFDGSEYISGKKAFKGMDKFLSKPPTFSGEQFYFRADRARNKWVVKTKVIVQSKHN